MELVPEASSGIAVLARALSAAMDTSSTLFGTHGQLDPCSRVHYYYITLLDVAAQAQP